jgi:hypothetical protein
MMLTGYESPGVRSSPSQAVCFTSPDYVSYWLLLPSAIEIQGQAHVAALPEAVWRAIVDAEMTRAYAYVGEGDLVAVSGTAAPLN